MAEFVGSDRGLRRLAVTPIEQGDLEQVPTVRTDAGVEESRAVVVGSPKPYAVVIDEVGGLRGWVGERELRDGGDGAAGVTAGDRARRFDATAEVGDSLRSALAEIVQYDAGWLPVVARGRFLGVLTPTSVYGALRRATPDGGIDGTGDPEDRREGAPPGPVDR